MARMDEQPPAGKSLIDLNDDCIRHICMFISNRDRMNLAIACDSFDETIGHFIQSSLVEFNEWVRRYSVKQTENLFKRFGAYIKLMKCIDLEGHDSPSDSANGMEYLRLIPAYCHNIEEFIMCSHWESDFTMFKQIFSSAPRIRKVIVRASSCMPLIPHVFNNMDLIVKDLLSNLLLKSMHAPFEWGLTGENLWLLKHLSEVDLRFCEGLDPKHFLRFLRTVKLKSLNIVNCPKLTSTVFETLYETQTNLESLAISNNYNCNNIELVGRLESLRHIEIVDFREMWKMQDILQELIQHHANDLKSLVFCSERTYRNDIEEHLKRHYGLAFNDVFDGPYDPELDDYILDTVKNCQSLENLTVDIYGSCGWLKEEAFVKIISQSRLKSLSFRPGPQFKIDTLKRMCEILKAKNMHLNLRLDERNFSTCIEQTPEYREIEKNFKIHVDEVRIDEMLVNSFLF